MESSSSATPSEQNLSNIAGSKRKRDSDPPISGAESSEDFQACSIDIPVSQKVKENEILIKSIPFDKRHPDPPAFGVESSNELQSCFINNPGSPKVKDGLLTATGSEKVKDDLLSLTAGSVGDSWNSGPNLFPHLDVDSYESSDDESQSISIPRPPPYVPYPPDSCRDDTTSTKNISSTPDDMTLMGDSVVQKPGKDGRYSERFYKFAKEVFEWYNSKTGRKFEFVDFVEVVLEPVFGVVCDLTMKAVDGDAPTGSPVIFEGKYWWGKYDEVVSCKPLINTVGSKQMTDSDPPALVAENAKYWQYCAIDMPAERPILKVSELGKRHSDPLKNFLRDPRISCTELSRVRPHPILKPGGQNVKDNEPNLSRDEVGQEPIVKSQYCEDYFSDGGCKNEMCRFAHGDWELNEPLYIPPEDAIVFHPSCGKRKRKIGIFGISGEIFTAKAFPYIKESHIGIVFGKRGELFQWICDLTGVKLTVENNEQVPGFKKIVISGTTDRCCDASTLVKALLGHFVLFSEREKIPPVVDYKTQLCKKYAVGRKHDAETCYFAHGDSELRLSSVQILQSAMKARREGKDYNLSF